MSAELPGTPSPAGNTVASIFGASFNDADGNRVGVAVVGVAGTASGTWEYSTDGTTWTSFGTAKTTFGVPSSSNALLLSANDLIRFMPNAGFVGTVTLQAFAWDGTQGTAVLPGATKGYKIATAGSGNAFSDKPATVTVAVNTAPVL